MSIPARIRFEVLKRDRYTCQYCGAHPPDILVEVDHVLPRAAGGGNEAANLVVACADCNRGKSDRLLDEGGQPTVSKKTVAALEERLAQTQAYMDLMGQLSTAADAMMDLVRDEWAKAFRARTEEREGGSFWVLDDGSWPNEATLRTFLRELDIEAILGAVDMAASRIGPNPGNDRYFYAICWRLIREKRSGGSPVDADRVAALEAENLRLENELVEANDLLETENRRLQEELAEAQELIGDLRLNIQRLREDAGRD